MRTVSYRVSDLHSATIPLGFAGENLHRRIIFKAEEVYSEYPHAAASLTVRPPYGVPYTAAVTRDGNDVIWDVENSDLVRSGMGELQLAFTQDETICKTYIAKTRIGRSIIPTGEVPTPLEDFLMEAGAALTAIPETIDAALEAAKESGEFDGPKGDKGDPGQDGYTPQRGVDYWTNADQAAMRQDIADDTAAARQAIAGDKQDALTAIGTAGTTQVGNVNAAGTTQVDNVNAAGTTQVQAVAYKGEEVLESIPSDYSELSSDVSNLKSAINDTLDIETTLSKNLNKTPYSSTHTEKGVTFTKNTDGSITMEGTPTGDIYWPSTVADDKWLLPAGTYTLSGGRSKMSVDLLLYENKSDSRSAMSKSSGATETTFTTEEDYWAWIRFTILSTASPDGLTIYPQLENGSQATEYQDPDYVGYKSTVIDGMNENISGVAESVVEIEEDVSGYGDAINALDSKVSGIVETKTKKNLVDPTKLVQGHIQSNGTIATNGAYANYSTSDYVMLEENTDYAFSNYNSSGNLRTSQSVTCVLFDESKTVIANSYQSVSDTGYLTFNSGTTAKYVRVTTSTSGSFFQLESGRTTPSAYEAYSANDVIRIQLGDTPMEQVQEQINNAIGNSGIIQFEVGKNLVDPDKRVTGYIQSNGSISAEQAYAIYSTSDYIELEANTDYAFAGFGESTHSLIDYNRVACLLFDESKTQITGTYQDLSSETAHGVLTFNSGTTAKYARVTTKTSAIFQLEKGTTTPTTYEEYSGRYVVGYPLGKTPLNQTQMGNILYGKKWAVCGDSFTDGATDGQITDDGLYKGYRYVYPYLIGNRNEMEIVKFFNGGETLAFPAQPGTFTNSLTNPNGTMYYQNIPADTDYITIYLGINDANHASGSSQDGEDTTGYIPLGTITDDTTASYYGAWNVVLSWLITNRPTAHIGIIVTNGISSTQDYRNAQIAIAKKYGLPYIDLNGDERTPSMHRTCNPDIASSVKDALLEKWSVSGSNSHPNDAAHLFESTFIENFLRSI